MICYFSGCINMYICQPAGLRMNKNSNSRSEEATSRTTLASISTSVEYIMFFVCIICILYIMIYVYM